MQTRLDLLVIGALAIYRLWRLVAKDRITQKWREAIYDRWPPTHQRALARSVWDARKHEPIFTLRSNTPNTPKDRVPKVSWLTASLACPWCAPTLACVALTVAVDACFGLTWPVLWAAALGTVVGLLGRADGA